MLTIAKLSLRSATFTDGGRLPSSMVYNGWGHKGDNRSPHLVWGGSPAGTKSFALEGHDPDAPTAGIGFTHWILFDIPASVSELAENIEAGRLPAGTKKGLSDLGVPGYAGAAPPPGPAHRYIFTVYALSEQTLGLGDTTTLAMLRFSIREKKLAEGRITGLHSL
jgi:Raf kinase inhibitor-like YbhB/YbcL family protein